jgi:hypothetical protein
MKYIGIGKCSKYYVYILVAFISEFVIGLLFGLNPTNRDLPLRIIPINPKLYGHPLFKNFINFTGILSGGIILYFLEKLYDKKKEGEISINKYEKIKSQILGQKKGSRIFSLIIVGLLFSIYNILTDFFDIKLWMFEIIYICILSFLILKININTHKKIAIIIMVGPLLIISLISLSLPRTHCEDSENCNKSAFKTIIDNYGSIFHIPLILIICEVITFMKDYTWVESKFLMDIRYVHHYKILLFIGIIGIILSSISMYISTNIPCKAFNNIIKVNYTYYQNDRKKLDLSNELCRLNDYDNTKNILYLYYDNFSIFFRRYSKFRSNTLIELFIFIPIFFIMCMIKSYCHIMIIKYLEPNIILIVENFYYFIRAIARIIANKADEKYLTNTQFILNIIQEIITIICNMIYIELLELKFCNLDYDLRRKINQRSDDEYLQSEESLEKNYEITNDDNSLINLSQDLDFESSST